MTTPKTHIFDGQPQTLAQIRSTLSCYSETSLMRHINAGRNTRAQVLGFHTTAAKQRNGRLDAKAAPFQLTRKA